MSRVGRATIKLPQGVKASIEGSRVDLEGPKGKLSLTLPAGISVSEKESILSVSRSGDEKKEKALHGLCRALINNMAQGVSAGFERALEIVGVGYKANVQGSELTLSAGYSHAVTMRVPEGLTVELPKPTQINIKGCDKRLVGQFAASIRQVASPEPYKGKGIKYAGEAIRRKAGKAAAGAKAG